MRNSYCYLELAPEVVHGLGEVNMDAAVVDEYIVHLEEGVLRGFVSIKANEGVAERIARLPVADDVAGGDGAKAREYDLKILHRQGSSKP